MTEPDREIDSIEELQDLANSGVLNRHTASRFAFAQNPENTLLFIDGEDYEVTADFAKALCRQRQINLDELLQVANKDEKLFIVELYNQGKIYLEWTSNYSSLRCEIRGDYFSIQSCRFSSFKTD